MTALQNFIVIGVAAIMVIGLCFIWSPQPTKEATRTVTAKEVKGKRIYLFRGNGVEIE